MASALRGSFQWLSPFISSLSRSLSPFPPSQTIISLTQYTEVAGVTWYWCFSLNAGRKYAENVLAEPWEDPGDVSAAESVCWAWGDSDLFHCCPDAEQVTGGRDRGSFVLDFGLLGNREQLISIQLLFFRQNISTLPLSSYTLGDPAPVRLGFPSASALEELLKKHPGVDVQVSMKLILIRTNMGCDGCRHLGESVGWADRMRESHVC